MIFSFYKLKELAQLDESVNHLEMMEAINNIGFEVTGFYHSIWLEGVEYGFVEKVYPNPKADGLSVCEIKFADKTRIIQTTAKNVIPNKYVVAFVPGSKLKGAEIEAKMIKGIKSEGMLSSIEELGFEKEFIRPEWRDDILLLDDRDLTKDPIKDLYLNDYLFLVDILTNRSDANAYLIIAREIAAFFKKDVKKLELIESKKEIKDLKVVKNKANELAFLETLSDDINIKIGDIILLLKSEIKTINDAVDLSNLVLIMAGMPTHVYDKDKIEKNIEADIMSGEFTMFGDKNVELENNLVIKDKNKIISLAGVMGSTNSSFENNSKTALFEMGIFPKDEIRRSMKTIKLDSNSGRQASKEISNGTVRLAFAFLQSKLNNFSQIINLPKKTNIKMTFDYSYLDKIAGFEFSKSNQFPIVIDSLKKIGFKFNGNEIIVPSYRHDVTKKQDIIEEMFRYYGLTNLGEIQPFRLSFKTTKFYFVHEKLLGNGFQEVNTNTLTSRSLNKFNPFNFKKTVQLKTYTSLKRSEIRNSMAVSLYQIVDHNKKRKFEKISIFDMGTINDGVRAVCFASNQHSLNEMQNIAQNISPQKLEFKRVKNPSLHGNVSANIYFDKVQIGWVGQINPQILNTDLYFVEIKYDYIEQRSSRYRFKVYDEKPLKSRDVTYEIGLKDTVWYYLEDLHKIEGVAEIRYIREYVDKKEKKIKLTFRVYVEDGHLDAVTKALSKKPKSA